MCNVQELLESMRRAQGISEEEAGVGHRDQMNGAYLQFFKVTKLKKAKVDEDDGWQLGSKCILTLIIPHPDLPLGYPCLTSIIFNS